MLLTGNELKCSKKKEKSKELFSTPTERRRSSLREDKRLEDKYYLSFGREKIL